jgi:hypothetical protein
MIRVAGLWELGWNTPLPESWLWSFVLREFNVTEWDMFPKTGIIHNGISSGLNLTEYNSIPEMIDSYDTSVTRVFLQEDGDVELGDFQHPDNVVYIFGNAGTTPSDYSKRDSDVKLRIQTPNKRGVLWPHQVLLTVLYDRYKKSE